MKENAKSWVIDESKLTEEQKMQQDIFDILNKLTMDNYEEFRTDLVHYLSDYNQSKYMSDCIINKALNEKIYTQLFCNLIKFLVDKNVKTKKPDSDTVSTFRMQIVERIDYLGQQKFKSLKKLKTKQLT